MPNPHPILNKKKTKKNEQNQTYLCRVSVRAAWDVEDAGAAAATVLEVAMMMTMPRTTEELATAVEVLTKNIANDPGKFYSICYQ